MGRLRITRRRQPSVVFTGPIQRVFDPHVTMISFQLSWHTAQNSQWRTVWQADLSPPASLYSFSLPFPSPALSHRSLTRRGFLEVLIHLTAGCAHESHWICLYFQSCERHLGSGRATSPSSFYRMKDLNSYSKQRLL